MSSQLSNPLRSSFRILSLNLYIFAQIFSLTVLVRIQVVSKSASIERYRVEFLNILLCLYQYFFPV